jgi:hypothetical protein
LEEEVAFQATQQQQQQQQQTSGRRFDMRANIRGLVERLDLAAARGVMPLFEAISNAMDAIEQKGRGISYTCGTVRIRLIPIVDLAEQAGDKTLVVDGIEVTDDGIGFNDANMASFGEAYTLSKVQVGGKGVGRFTFLKVFSSVSIRSVYEAEDGKHVERSFVFSISDEVSEEKSIPTTSPVGTVVTLRGMSAKYRKAWPSDPTAIAQNIVAHFLVRFAARSCPAMVLESPYEPSIDLHRLFEQTIQPHLEERLFQVGGETFGVQVFRNKDPRGRHEYHLCANGREVTTETLRDLLTELPERLLDGEGQLYTLTVLVTGEYLDRHASQERSHISFEREGDLNIDEALVSKKDLEKAVSSNLREMLSLDLRTTNEEKVSQIEQFVQKAPEYRVLTHEKYRTLIEQEIQPGLSEEKLDEALLHLRRKVEDSVRKDERHVAALMETESFEQYQEKIRNLMETMNEVGKSKLADYVAHRRTILDLIGLSLNKVQADDTYPFEKVLHKMIFPMGLTSKDVFLDQQNLWLIDERLCFHTLLTSDKKLKSIPGLEGTSGKEPDIFAWFYDTPIGVAEPDNLPGGGVVIVEFKRPGRDDYDRDPADQIIQRFVEIEGGAVRDIDGRIVNPSRLRYIGYLIADLTPSLHRNVALRYKKTADNEGYFATLPDGNGYVEIVSYDKLLRDAKRRNRMLFEKLGIHKH